MEEKGDCGRRSYGFVMSYHKQGIFGEMEVIDYKCDYSVVMTSKTLLDGALFTTCPAGGSRSSGIGGGGSSGGGGGCRCRRQGHRGR